MFGRVLSILCAASLLGMAGASAYAQGTCTACDLPPSCRGAATGGTKKDICTVVLLSVDSGVDFGRLILLGGKVGHVVLDANSGSKLVFGALEDDGGFAVQGTATITGQPLRRVAVTMPTSVTLTDVNGAQAVLKDFRTTLPAAPTLDSYGNLQFSFAGTLYTDAAVLAGGTLRARLPITVDYN
ncbi:MAG: DUF4402 domain-containing protein [Tsuneonella sp.]